MTDEQADVLRRAAEAGHFDDLYARWWRAENYSIAPESSLDDQVELQAAVEALIGPFEGQVSFWIRDASPPGFGKICARRRGP